MILHGLRWLLLLMAIAPLAYFLLSIYCSADYFRSLRRAPPQRSGHAPPVSVLKPVRGLDREAYENFASYCRQDYPEYEILFAVNDADDPVVPVIERLIRDFPGRSIRLLVGVPQLGASSKVNKLCRLVQEAKHDLVVMSDSDVRVEPDYLREVASHFSDPQVGAVTTLYRGQVKQSFGSELDALGNATEFAASTLVARRLEGLRFTLGATMATTKGHLAQIGGFEALVNHHSDDFELGNRLAALGYRVELLRKPVGMILPAQSLGDFLRHELRWTVGLRHVRPWGHLGLILTLGFPWMVLAAVLAPAASIALAYVLAYLVLRLTMAWIVGVWGLQSDLVRRSFWLLPLRDAFSFGVWVASFFSNRIRWRGLEFVLDKGLLVPVTPPRQSGAAVDGILHTD